MAWLHQTQEIYPGRHFTSEQLKSAWKNTPLTLSPSSTLVLFLTTTIPMKFKTFLNSFGDTPTTTATVYITTTDDQAMKEFTAFGKAVDYLLKSIGSDAKYTKLITDNDYVEEVLSPAFGDCWHTMILRRLIQKNCPLYLLKVISSFLNKRSIEAAKNKSTIR